jgi:hypothetical protein
MSITRRESRATSFAAFLHPDFTVAAPNYLPWGGRHVGAAFFRDHLLPGVTNVFDFAWFGYDNVIAEDGHVVAVFNIGVTGTDAIVKIVDHWTLRDGKAISLFRAAGRARETRDQASGRRRGLDDIRNTRRIAKMYLSGVEVDRAALRQSLNR